MRLSICLAALILTAGLPAQTTISSGSFLDPAIWDTGRVPGATDDATISAGHIVGMAKAGMRSTPRALGSLTVSGTLTGSYPMVAGGNDVRIITASCVVTATGVIRGDLGTARGGDVVITAPMAVVFTPLPVFGFVAGTFTNAGLVRGGDGPTGGGFVRIFYSKSLGMPGASTGTNTGVIRGGNGHRGGRATLLSSAAFNWGTIRGGNGTGSGTSGDAGGGRLGGMNFPPLGTASATNAPGGLVRGGDATAGGSGGDGIVTCAALPGAATALNDGVAGGGPVGTIAGGDGCRAGRAFLFGSPAINRGVMRAGDEVPGSCAPRVRRTRFDPPDGIIEDGARFDADRVELIGGSSLTIRNLTDPNPVVAQDLVLGTAPGGTLDLGAVAVGQLSAQSSVTVMADNVILPAGLTLDQLIPVASGAPVVTQPGTRFSDLDVFADEEVRLWPGEIWKLRAFVHNGGNMAESVAMTLTLPSGLHALGTTSMSLSTVTIEAQGAHAIDLSIPIAPSATFGPATVTLDAVPLTAVEPGAAVTAPFTVHVGDDRPGAAVWDRGEPLSLSFIEGPAMNPADGHFAVRSVPSLPFFMSIGLASPGAEGFMLQPGLTLYVDLAEVAANGLIPFPTNAQGQLFIPVDLGLPLLAGNRFYFQGIAPDPSQSSGFQLSNGLALAFN